MKFAHDIIRKPIITERSMEGISENKYVFEVAPNAGKIEIKKAVEEIFGVKVAKVNTIKLPGKWKRMGVYRGKRPDNPLKRLSGFSQTIAACWRGYFPPAVRLVGKNAAIGRKYGEATPIRTNQGVETQWRSRLSTRRHRPAAI